MPVRVARLQVLDWAHIFKGVHRDNGAVHTQFHDRWFIALNSPRAFEFLFLERTRASMCPKYLSR